MTRRGIALSATALLAARPAAAQAFPDRPVRLIVPFAPGGPADVQARLLAAGMSERLRQSVVVENRSGAGGIVGTDAVAKAPPDGHTLVFSSTGAVAITIHMVANPPYDPARAFAPVSMITRVPILLMTNPRLPVRTLQELVAVSKTRPLNFGSSGPGSSVHLAGELLRMRTGMQFTHVPYRGAAPATMAVVQGEVDFALLDPTALIEQVRSGAVRPIAVTSAGRSPAMPEVPTFAEAGVPGIELENWYPVLAPAGTPPDRLQALFGAIRGTLEQPALRDQITNSGAAVVASTPEETAAYIQAEIPKWAELVRSSGARMD
ncbi:tripartite tricarboxylate transporter substrate binding protein [Roseomonas terrae]|uniref:Tripartite tricarboxylate transporter substrate binding protein n=2 Tax=Neoroseomonas terrae TaxID=424799 RepID=A0ABS5EIJ6_9PROT|nr:tripartite tricarboxylate transporter substrate binding protein [Neoroseomonas terrae]